MRGSAYIWKRIVFAVVTVFVALTLNFILFRVLPGGPVSQISRVPNASPALKQALTAQFGLDKPLWEQYLLYLQQTQQGKFFLSFILFGARKVWIWLLLGGTGVLCRR